MLNVTAKQNKTFFVYLSNVSCHLRNVLSAPLASESLVVIIDRNRTAKVISCVVIHSDE